MTINPASRLPPNAALIIVDVQKGVDDARWGRRNNSEAEANIARLLDAWRRSNRPIFHVQHSSRLRDSPLSPSAAGHAIKEIVAPRTGEPVISKSVNSAFIGTDLEERLRGSGIRTIVVTGLTTDHCVATTAAWLEILVSTRTWCPMPPPHSTAKERMASSTVQKRCTQ